MKQLLALDCISYEGFSTSGNTAVTSQEHPARTEVAYNLLDGMNRLAVGTMLSMVLQPFSSFAEHGLHTYTLPPPRWAHVDNQKMESRPMGSEGGFKSHLWVPMGRVERQIIHSTSLLK